jgi:cytochrome P450
VTTSPSRGAAFDPFDPATRACPYPAYRRLREAAPVSLHPQTGIWWVSGHADAHAVLRDQRFSAADGQQLRGRADDLPVTMLSSDPPEHTRLRDAVMAELGGARVRRLAPGTRATAAGRVAQWPERGVVNAVGDYAMPVVADALGRLLGIPRDDVDRFERWAVAVAPLLDPLDSSGPESPAAAALSELLDWVAELLLQRLGAPTRDVFGALVGAYEAGALSGQEVRNTCGLLVVGGFEPVVDLIGTALWLLLGDRDRAAPPVSRKDVASVVEEALRYEPPIHFAARVPVEDVELSSARVRAGEPVVVLVAAANRDPARFDDPDRFEPRRRPNPHLTFGAGIHACPGAAFARMVARIAVTAAVEGAPALRLAGAPVWRDGFVPRGLAALELDACG